MDFVSVQTLKPNHRTGRLLLLAGRCSPGGVIHGTPPTRRAGITCWTVRSLPIGAEIS